MLEDLKLSGISIYGITLFSAFPPGLIKPPDYVVE